MGGEDVNRGVAKKEEVCSNLIDDSLEKISDGARGLKQVKLIDDDHARLIGLLNEAGNLLVLGCNSVYCIYDQGADIRAFDAFLRPHDAEDFNGGIVLSPWSHAGGINQEIRFAVAFVGDIDGIPRRAGGLADDRALIPENRINEGRFPDVWAPHNGELEGGSFCGSGIVRDPFGEVVFDFCNQLSNPAAMSRADGYNILETQ